MAGPDPTQGASGCVVRRSGCREGHLCGCILSVQTTVSGVLEDGVRGRITSGEIRPQNSPATAVYGKVLRLGNRPRSLRSLVAPVAKTAGFIHVDEEVGLGPVETLWDELANTFITSTSAKVQPFRPAEIGRLFAQRTHVPVPSDRLLEGMSFFPVGTGLFRTRRGDALPELRPGGAMVVAHNWGSEDDYVNARGDAHYGAYLATNRQIVALLDDAGVDPHRCFFTNAYPCLIRGSSRIGALDIGPADPFDKFAHHFFLRQCQLIRPSVLVVLGKPAAMALGRWLDIRAWQPLWTFRTLCVAGQCITTPSLDGCAAAVVMPHPSMPNWRYFSYVDQYGRVAGVRAVADAWRLGRSIADNSA